MLVRCVASWSLLSLITACASRPAEEPAPAEAAPPTSAAPAAPAAPAPTPVAPATPAPEKVSARPAEWGYTDAKAPSHWAELSPAYAACGDGKAQSPIDLSSKTTGTTTSWRANYGHTSLHIAHNQHVHDIVDNGHTIQVTVDEGSSLTTEKNTYALKQFHFHTPSENTLDGRHFPMEVHFVHQAQDGTFAVVAAFFEEGPENPRIAELIKHFPEAPGDANHHPEVQLDVNLHLPKDLSAYSFLGSFTTPPCTEGVEWLVLRSSRTAAKAQLETFAARLNHNNRPVQALNGRAIQTARVGEGGAQ